MSRIIFVTGTDTGVGKTLVAALLLHHLRASGVSALAIKPFCSGGKEDVRLLQALQPREMTETLMNPFYFAEPVAPLVAARKNRTTITIEQVLEAIRNAQELCDCLIVEGAGGVLVPLGEDFDIADVIAQLNCETIVVGRNKLGTINHTLLSIEALENRGVKRLKVILCDERTKDFSSETNLEIIVAKAVNIGVFLLPHFGQNANELEAVKTISKKIKKTLAEILRPDSFTTRSRRSERRETKN